jgi:NAD(P)-dependent dehydrogenase (short-subunit alcohol dehydrogenase family)
VKWTIADLPAQTGRRFVITGASSGIGRSTAKALAAKGAHVVLAVRDTAKGEQVASEIAGDTEVRRLDLADLASIRAFAHDLQTIDVLFNNAGVMIPGDDDAVTTDEALWDRTMDINAKGVFLGCKHGIPALRRGGGGSIINTASFVALMGAATPQLAYTASKGAVLSLTRELAVIHARESIRVNAICPGPLRTELLMKVLDTDEKKQRRLVHIPMGRFGEAAEIAKAALFLASDDSSFMTGGSLVVDGGITAAYVTPL